MTDDDARIRALLARCRFVTSAGLVDSPEMIPA